MRYNLDGYNLATGGKHRYVNRVLTIYESLGAIVGKSKILNQSIRQNERLVNTVEISMIVARSRKISEKISFKSELLSIQFHKTHANENVTGDIQIGKNMYLPLVHNEEVISKPHAGKSFNVEATISEELGSHADIGKIMWHDREMYEILNSFLRMALRRYQTFYLNTTMPSGSEIRIDSNNFTVFLNHLGQTTNIRSQFSGDWVHFDRDIRRLYVVNEGVNLLEGDVIYNDRWL